MNKQQKIEYITKKCIEANLTDCNFSNYEGEAWQLRSITLCDVLLAIGELDIEKETRTEGLIVNTGGRMAVLKIIDGAGFRTMKNPNVVTWNLKDNNLQNQSEECINFIWKLLK